eukprot:1621629-Ditylum_brightwellii.AAC.1
MKRQDFPRDAANCLCQCVCHGCLQPPVNFDRVLDVLQEATRKLRLCDAADRKGCTHQTRGIRNLNQLYIAMHSLRIIPLLESNLGLYQQRKHINGQLLFQATMLYDSCDCTPIPNQIPPCLPN